MVCSYEFELLQQLNTIAVAFVQLRLTSTSL